MAKLDSPLHVHTTARTNTQHWLSCPSVQRKQLVEASSAARFSSFQMECLDGWGGTVFSILLPLPPDFLQDFLGFLFPGWECIPVQIANALLTSPGMDEFPIISWCLENRKSKDPKEKSMKSPGSLLGARHLDRYKTMYPRVSVMTLQSPHHAAKEKHLGWRIEFCSGKSQIPWIHVEFTDWLCTSKSCVYKNKYIYIHIYIWYPPKTHTFWQFTAICGILLFFSMFKCVCIFWRLFYIFKKLCRVVKTLPLIKLFSFNRMIFTKPRETQKTKKPKLFRECLVWGSCLFFLVFLEFFLFFFGHDLEKTKKIQGFFGFLDKLMVKELWKTKKTWNQKKSGFFCFFWGLLLHVF